MPRKPALSAHAPNWAHICRYSGLSTSDAEKESALIRSTLIARATAVV